jgi:hypothetical protein
VLTRFLLILSASAVLACTAGAQGVPATSAAKEHIYLDTHAIENSGAPGNGAQGKAAASAARVPATTTSLSQPSPSAIPVAAVPPAAPTPLIAIPASAAHVQRIELMRKYPPGILMPGKAGSSASHP